MLLDIDNVIHILTSLRGNCGMEVVNGRMSYMFAYISGDEDERIVRSLAQEFDMTIDEDGKNNTMYLISHLPSTNAPIVYDTVSKTAHSVIITSSHRRGQPWALTSEEAFNIGRLEDSKTSEWTRQLYDQILDEGVHVEFNSSSPLIVKTSSRFLINPTVSAMSRALYRRDIQSLTQF